MPASSARDPGVEIADERSEELTIGLTGHVDPTRSVRGGVQRA
jgi:hypothetical protein